MSIAKDLLLFSTLLIVFINYLRILYKLKMQKEDFINILSHDLRVSSIAQIRGVELLEKNDIPLEDKFYLVQELKKTCNFSLDMINMLINNFKYDSHEKFLNKEFFSLKNLLIEKSSVLNELAVSKNIKLQFSLKDDLIYGDKNELKKLFLNIYTTILERTERNSTIMFKSIKENSKIKISINYKGELLTLEEQNRMFSQKSKFSTVGHGIKMNLCKNIVDYHGGYIKIYSKNIYKCFEIILPISSPNINKNALNIELEPSTYNSKNKCFVNNLNNSSFQH